MIAKIVKKKLLKNSQKSQYHKNNMIKKEKTNEYYKYITQCNGMIYVFR
jgi:hypothetical protein